MRILVTGAAGFVGANLVRSWTDLGHEVHGLVRATSDPWRLVGCQCIQQRVDLTDEEDLLRTLDGVGPNAVVSAAAHGAYSYQLDVDRMIAVNLRAVERLVAWCSQHDVPLLHLGSSSEYGEQDHAPSEFERLRPNSMYAITKAAGTHTVCDAAARRSLRAVVFRLYSVYGPWEEPTRLMPTIARRALDGQLPPTLVDPAVARDFIHVDDVVAAASRWLAEPSSPSPPAVLNIGTGRQTTLGELAALMTGFGVSETPNWGSMPRRTWDTSCWVSNPGRAEAELGWRATVELEDGMRRLIRFVADHSDRYS
jgi:dolichol-phosphate mannosyltransferase